MKFTRSSGILLHPTSLPGEFGIGNIGRSAFTFIDWLSESGQTLWQILPFGPAGLANSPYMSLSAFAGNTLLIDLNELVERGYLTSKDLNSKINFSDDKVDYAKVTAFKNKKLKIAAKVFFNEADKTSKEQFDDFCNQEKLWLDDYALFQALNDANGKKEWTLWDKSVAKRNSDALNKAKINLADGINFYKFKQWCFATQWQSLKKYAANKKIKLFGDIPIFIAHHSADVWANPNEFCLDENGEPTVVAGVPPDYFCETGQRWGNPLYKWDAMKQNNYQWWTQRIKKTLALFDMLRIDHFRGFDSYWAIPNEEETAINGKWEKGPGEEFFNCLKEQLGELPIVAEDLGIVTEEVFALRKKLEFPGMKVLQFAFNSGPDNHFLPHLYENNFVVYTGTHDNDTTLGWFEKASDKERQFVMEYCKTNGSEINWDLIKLALNSCADTAIIPMQDVLGLGSNCRMNIPGSIEGNWEWRFKWDMINNNITSRLKELTQSSSRI